MTRLFATVGPFAPLVVFVLAAAESAAFVGVVVPGELAVILGGVAAGTGVVSLWLMIPAAVAGAIVGDSIGYRLGHRMGPALLSRPRMAVVAGRIDAAAALLSERGWWALVVARFAAFLRAVVPFAAGIGHMPYRQFLVGNAIGGVVWGTTFTLVGYGAGANYPTVERWFRTGGLAVAAIVAVVTLIVWTTRWVSGHRQLVIVRFDRLSQRGPLRYLVLAVRRSHRPAVVLSVAATAIVAGLWLFAGLIQDIARSEEFFFFDVGTIRYLDTNRVAPLINGARLIDSITRVPWPVVVGVVAVVSLVVARRFRMAVAATLSLFGQWLLVELTAALVDRVPPALEPLASRIDYGFPSAHVALIAAIVIFASWPWDRPGWKKTVLRLGIAVLIVALTGMSRVVLLIDYQSDTIGGAAVAAAWTLLVCLVLDARLGIDQSVRA